ncbi:insulinase family protein [Paenibacillus macerans]|uniref:Insulinase family protein n=1 Tax=Paenibacillus macerans TaxID=44252 RepID=A0A6N8ESM6_PAEMA|nr:pitrilysin family protein [Paenibacillus macerans]MEC0331064.1 pitrilysin family protein [Paenibacillus macerans]MUG21753.1 insulinase family protein [Paenibacillus macerans]UMV46374.1 insulinase family protein [Paenibacillus macerans]GBK63428.1 insulinase family protein [Paenibacillus macerans]GBK69740.1 insulinase family protein [Paenibacillus macerans]
MKRTQLKNGLRVVMEQIPTCRSVSFGIWVKTGSRNEQPEVGGISHFIEHMLFKGTDRFSARDIAEQFDAIGGNVNAFTSKEYTCYYAKVLDEHLPIAVDVLADMFFRSLFDAEELRKEKNVIVEEISMYEDTPDDMVHDLVSQAAYGDHPLALPILGTEEKLRAMESDHLRAYMREHYTIENTVISVAGNIDDQVVELLEKYFGDFAIRGDRGSLAAPDFLGDLKFYRKKTEQNHICLSFPGLPIGDEKQYAMTLLNNALGGGMSSRLFQEIRERRGLAYSVYSYHSSHADSGLFTVYAGTAPRQTKEVLELTKEILHDVSVNGINESELGKGKEQLKGSLILSLESTGSRMNRLGKNELMLGRHYTLDEMIARIEAVTMDDVNDVLGRMFSRPFALAMVGGSDRAITGLRRDELVI